MAIDLTESQVARGAVDTFRDGDAVSNRNVLAEIQVLTHLVGELTLTLVVQGAWLSAIRNHRTRPTAFDVDEAISFVSESVPDCVAEDLWRTRDEVLCRIEQDASMA